MKDETFTGKGILICKKTGEVIKLGDVTIKEICNGELEPGDEHIELNRPSFIGGEKITFSVKVRSKRKGRKFRYSLERLLGNRVPKYRSKRELMSIYQKVFCPQGLPMPIDDYLKHTHKQLMNLLVNTAYIVKKEREYYKDPFEIVVPDCGDRNEVVIDTGGFTPV